MKIFLTLLSYSTLALNLVEGKEDLKDQKVLKCKLKAVTELEKFKKFDVWSYQSRSNSVIVRVRNPKESEDLSTKYSCDTVIGYLNSHMNKVGSFRLTTTNNSSSYSEVSDADFFKDFQSYATMATVLKRWAKKYPKVATFVPSIGKSYENRDIFAFKISTNSSTKEKKSIWFNGGLHAREWIAPSAVLYLIHKFLEGSDKEPVKGLLNTFDFYFTPLGNPDGYEYSRSGDRFWRKNRRKNADNTTYGVDLNRNWDDHWGVVGASTDPADEVYQGTTPNSEPEVKALAKFALNLPKRYGGIDFHSYGQLILRNWGWTTKLSTNEKVLLRLSQKMFDAQKANNFNYTVETSAGFYPASGALDDWMASKAKLVSFTIELCPDDGLINFMLPPKDILACVKANFDMVLAYSKFLAENPNIPPNRLTY